MSRGEPGRNDPCPCGSGKKYKRCHLGVPPPAPLNVTLHERNTTFVDAVSRIFELRRGTWADVKRRVTPDRIRELYKVHQLVWAAPLPDLLPTRSSELTSLFLGTIDPEDLALRIFRFGLYTDRILVLNPFTFPTVPGRHPIDDPNSYVRDTLKLVYFMARMEPWIRAGFVTLIGDPMAYDPRFRAESMNAATTRMKTLGAVDPRDLENTKERQQADMRRILASTPRSSLEARAKEMHPDWPADRVTALVDELVRSNEVDPLGMIPYEEDAAPPREMILAHFAHRDQSVRAS